MDALNKGEHARVATQVATELAPCAQALFGLSHKGGIALEDAESQGIVNMQYGYALALQSFAQ